MPVKSEKKGKQDSPVPSSEKKKRVSYVSSKVRKSQKSSLLFNSTVNPGLAKSDYYSKMRNSIFNKHKKSHDKLSRYEKKPGKAEAGGEGKTYTSKILEKRRRALQKNLSAQKLDRSGAARVKKNISLTRKQFGHAGEKSLLATSQHIYPRIHEKKRRAGQEFNSSYNHLLPRSGFSHLNQSKSSNNINFLGKKKFEESSKMYQSIKKSYSKGIQKGKRLVMTSDNFMNFKKPKNVVKRSPNPSKSSSKKYSRERLQDKNRQVNRSLQYKQKNSLSNKVGQKTFFVDHKRMGFGLTKVKLFADYESPSTRVREGKQNTVFFEGKEESATGIEAAQEFEVDCVLILIESNHPYEFFKKKNEKENNSYFKKLQRGLQKKPSSKIHSYYMFQNLKK